MSAFYGGYETKGGKERERQQSAFIEREFFGNLAETHHNREQIVDICYKGMKSLAEPSESEKFYIGLLKSFKWMFETPAAPLPSPKQIAALKNFLTSYQAAKYINEYQIEKEIAKTRDVPTSELLARIEVLERAVETMAAQSVELATQLNNIVKLLNKN